MKVIIIPNEPMMAGRHYSFARTLVDQGHEVHYFTWDLPYHLKPAEVVAHLFTSLSGKVTTYERFTLHRSRRLPFFWPYINGWLFKLQLRKLYKKLNADIIFTESYTNETEVPKDLPFIYDLADDYSAPADVYGSAVYKLAFRLLGVRSVMKRQCQNAKAVTAVSETLYNYANQHNKNTYKLPNGVDKEIIDAVKKDKSSYPTNKYSMVYVARFGSWTRPIETIQATIALRKEFPNIELTLVGDGAETNNILNFIKDNQAESYIHYKGYVHDRKATFSLMNHSAIGLSISDKNKWRDAANPLKVVEYSALGKKVVSTNLVEVEALNFPNVFTFSDKRGKNDLIKVMRRAVKDKTDHRDYQAISKHVLSKYDWAKLTRQLIEIAKESKRKTK